MSELRMFILLFFFFIRKVNANSVMKIIYLELSYSLLLISYDWLVYLQQ